MLGILALLGLFRRKLVMLILLVAAIAGPYLAMEPSWRQSLSEKFRAWTSRRSTPLNALDPLDVSSELPLAASGGLQGQSPSVLPAKVEGPAIRDLRQVFRFDITPGWITTRWSRVTTVVSDVELEGLRVPLVTGTGLQDLAGSLTYYFDQEGSVQRIQFRGVTGDPRQIADLAEKEFHMRRTPSLSAGLYLSLWNAEPKSALLITHAPVVRASQPHARFHLEMELNLPNNYYGLSRDFAQRLEQQQQSSRW